jgi:hypothetical protein
MMAQQQSMFGPTPQELQQMFMQQQQAQDMNQANQWGQGSLGQQISTAGYMGGTMLGRGLQGLGQAAGIIPEDPRIAEARKMMEIKKDLMESNIDPSDIDTFYPEMIKKLNAAGFVDQANKAMQQYTQAQTAQGNLEARRTAAELQAQTAAERAAKLRADAVKDEAEQRAIKGRASVVRKKNPELTEEEALGIAADSNAFKTYMETPKVNTATVAANGRRLLINKNTGDIIKDLGVAGTSLGEGLSALGAGLASKREAEKAGTGVAEASLDVQNRYDALDSITEANKMLSQGIYAGFYGPTMEALSAATQGAIGDKKRLANTQKFRSYIGEVVIPRLKDFGGSDTVEELNYLKNVLAGDTRLEPEAIKAILKSSEEKIRARIKRLQQQQQSVRTGTQLPVGPVNTKTISRTLTSGVVVEELQEGE